MNDDCRKAFVDVVAKRASNILSDHTASANEKVDAYMCCPGFGWAKQLVSHASARKMSQILRGGLAYPSTKPSAKQLRTDLNVVWFQSTVRLRRKKVSDGYSLKRGA